jgi:hypothetical protein
LPLALVIVLAFPPLPELEAGFGNIARIRRNSASNNVLGSRSHASSARKVWKLMRLSEITLNGCRDFILPVLFSF